MFADTVTIIKNELYNGNIVVVVYTASVVVVDVDVPKASFNMNHKVLLFRSGRFSRFSNVTFKHWRKEEYLQ